MGLEAKSYSTINNQTVARCVAAAERQLRVRPSHPQVFVGRWMAEVPIPPP
jgi:hypothetical protein